MITWKSFAAMFSQLESLYKFNLARTKSMYVINHGLAPFFKSMLNDSLQKCNIHVFYFNESLNEVTQTCEMDMYIRSWNDNSNTVNVRCGSSFLERATHPDLFYHFNSLTKDFDPTHLYQISMDGANVNMKFFEEFSQQHKERSFHSLINIGSCGLHIVYGSFSRGETKSGRSLKIFLKGFYYVLHNSPARREDYESVTGSNSYPLSFCLPR